MKGMLVVLRSDAGDIVRGRAFAIVAALVGLLTTAAAIGITIALRRWLTSGIAWDDARRLLELFVGLAVNYVPLTVLFASMATWATDPIAKEKAKGPMESLLATPLTAQALWIGKSLAIFLPAYVMGFISSLVVILVLNLAAIVPTVHHFVLPVPEAVTSFVMIPLVMLGLISVGVLFSLITNPVVGQTIVMFMGMVLLQMVGQFGGRVTWLLASWDWVLYNLAGALLLAVVAVALSRMLTKERIILSSKGKWA